jgi:hypothetical protein
VVNMEETLPLSHAAEAAALHRSPAHLVRARSGPRRLPGCGRTRPGHGPVGAEPGRDRGQMPGRQW